VPANPSPELRLAMAYFDAWTSKDVDRAKHYVAADLGVRRRWDGRARARTVASLTPSILGGTLSSAGSIVPRSTPGTAGGVPGCGWASRVGAGRASFRANHSNGGYGPARRLWEPLSSADKFSR